MLTMYVRNKHGHPIGKVIAMPVSDTEWNVGWSLCHPLDRWDPNIADRIAKSRALNDKWTDTVETCIPHKVSKMLADITKRGQVYFKDKMFKHAKIAVDLVEC